LLDTVDKLDELNTKPLRIRRLVLLTGGEWAAHVAEADVAAHANIENAAVVHMVNSTAWCGPHWAISDAIVEEANLDDVDGAGVEPPIRRSGRCKFCCSVSLDHANAWSEYGVRGVRGPRIDERAGGNGWQLPVILLCVLGALDQPAHIDPTNKLPPRACSACAVAQHLTTLAVSMISRLFGRVVCLHSL
jgi:hypothetical protein